MQLLFAGDPRLAPSTDLQLARQQVLAVPTGDGEVEDYRGRILDWIDAHPDALLRSCAEAHLTGSALVLDPSTHAVLLLHHRKLQRWLQPGGHADGEANLAAAALREALEETGIEGLAVAVPAVDLDIHRVAPPSETAHLHLDVRHLVVAPAGSQPQGNHESTAIRWVDTAHLGEYELDPGLRRLIGVAWQMLPKLTP